MSPEHDNPAAPPVADGDPQANPAPPAAPAPAAPVPDAAPPAPAPAPQAPAPAPAAEAPSLRKVYADWPQEGDERDQPWDLDALGVSAADRELEAGARDTVSPVRIRHNCPILAEGEASPFVADLGRRLGTIGIPTTVTQGANPLNIVDGSVMSAVERFRETYGVEEDPTPYGGITRAARDRAGAHVGPVTWEAIIRVSDRLEREADEDDEQLS